MGVARKLSVARTLLRLGPVNIARVARYRLGLKAGRYRLPPPALPAPGGVFFASQPAGAAPSRPQSLFSWQAFDPTGQPDWHQSPFSPDLKGRADLPWDQAMAALPAGADVKEIWELSRFYWVGDLALAARNGDRQAGALLNHWLADWVAANPAYLGVNWGCGQEAALRLLHLAQAALILEEVDQPTPALRHLVTTLAARIAPTLHYALGQANNHGSAEAAGLFVAGSWLMHIGGDTRAAAWQKTGRRWLEDRARLLIQKDGSSNQYSTTYHRVVLDTYAFAELWRRRIGQAAFSTPLHTRMWAATRWLYEVCDPVTGDGPNIGANDGSLLLAPTRPPYRDFRPSVQLAAALFGDVLAYEDGEFEDRLALYDLARPGTVMAPPASETFAEGGYHVLRRGRAAAVMRFPRFCHRPGHADALHVDLHLGGCAVLCDGGSFSYGAAAEALGLGRTGAHNTVEFDGRDQMPRLGRFLYGNWLKTRSLAEVATTPEGETCAAGYRDDHAAEHHRALTLREDALVVEDRVAGFECEAVLRWRLAPGEYVLEGQTVTGPGGLVLTVTADVALAGIALAQGWSSRLYLQKEAVPVLEVRLMQPGRIITEVRF